MAAQNKATKQTEKKEKNFKSRYDENRHCFRVDETTYVYREFHDAEHYTDHMLHVGDDDVTLEILDMLLGGDNAEAQDNEDERKHADGRFEASVAAADAGPGNAEGGFDFISSSHVDEQPDGATAARMNLAAGFAGSPELMGPEAVLFPKEEKPGRMQAIFTEFVLPHLSEKEMDLIYRYYGMGMFAKDIAAITIKKNGKPMSESGITKQLRQLREKVKELMEPHIDW